MVLGERLFFGQVLAFQWSIVVKIFKRSSDHFLRDRWGFYYGGAFSATTTFLIKVVFS